MSGMINPENGIRSARGQGLTGLSGWIKKSVWKMKVLFRRQSPRQLMNQPVIFMFMKLYFTGMAGAWWHPDLEKPSIQRMNRLPSKIRL